MFTSSSFGLLHLCVSYLLEPVVWLLMLCSLFAVMETGILVSERWFGIRKWKTVGDLYLLEKLAERRIERSDFLTRIAPMLGLMGTLIPLGPGLAALGEGELAVLTTAMSVAFDTTVLGLLVGIMGFVIGRLRRRWYDEMLTELEQQSQSIVAESRNLPSLVASVELLDASGKEDGN